MHFVPCRIRNFSTEASVVFWTWAPRLRPPAPTRLPQRGRCPLRGRLEASIARRRGIRLSLRTGYEGHRCLSGLVCRTVPSHKDMSIRTLRRGGLSYEADNRTCSRQRVGEEIEAPVYDDSHDDFGMRDEG